MIESDWSRNYVNDCIGRLKRLFRWAVENELVPPSAYHGLQAVPGLRRGRTEARETAPVKPVPAAFYAAVLSKVGREVRALRLYAQGLTLAQVAQSLGVVKSSVRNYLLCRGVRHANACKHNQRLIIPKPFLGFLEHLRPPR
jgi:hypothetical protein